MAQVSDRSKLEAILQDKKAQPVEITYSLLKEITGNFSKKIGAGGFGEVYKGVVGNGFVAVKKLKSSATTEDTKFHREVSCLSAVKHNNIVRFIGYCNHITHMKVQLEGRMVSAEVRERLFCLEYMPEGSLRSYCEATADETDKFPWHVCYKVINGICRGLQHLHKEQRIIHLDLKPENILLDVDMVPKISDFGLSRFLGEDKSRTNTNNRVGSLGYMAPEYIRSGHITFMADIYSLGVIISRMVAGYGTERSIKNVAEKWKSRTHGHGRTPWESLYKQVKTCIELSKMCMVDEPKNRPDIEQIIRRLDHSTTSNGVNISQVSPLNITTDARCHMLPSRSLTITHSENSQYWRWSFFAGSSSSSECAELLCVYFLAITGEIKTKDLSPDTGYTVYLVYKLDSRSSGFHAGQKSSIRLYGQRTIMESSVSLDPKAGRIHGGGATTTYPKARADSWMELKLAEFGPNDARLKNEESVIVDIREEDCSNRKTGLIVKGMEFRPNDMW